MYCRLIPCCKIGTIYFARTLKGALPAGQVLNRIMPRELSSVIVDYFSAMRLSTRDDVVTIVDTYIANQQALFNSTSPLGTSSLENHVQELKAGTTSMSGAIVGTGMFTITGTGSVFMQDSCKYLTISINCAYTDIIRWKSYDVLRDRGYFHESTPAWVDFCGYLEVVGNIVQDQAFAASYNVNASWTKDVTIKLE